MWVNMEEMKIDIRKRGRGVLLKLRERSFQGKWMVSHAKGLGQGAPGISVDIIHFGDQFGPNEFM